jgi:parallel beta-helix repeat protein
MALFATGCATGVTGDPAEVRGTEASVSGQVISDTGGEVEYWVEYGLTTAYGSETAHGTITVAAHQLVAVSRQIEGLARSTTYHYRFCARDSAQQGGPRCGGDRRLTTVNVDCGDTVSSNLVLSGDLDCVGADAPSGLVVGADGITIDLAGHFVIGNGGAAVDNGGGYDDVTVRNGSLEGFPVALLLDGASRNRAAGLRIGQGVSGPPGTETGLGVTIASGEDNVIVNSLIQGFDGGVAVTGSDRLVARDSTATGRFGPGIDLQADFARVRDNRLSSIHASAIEVEGSGNRIRGNLATGSTGIAIRAGESNVVRQNLPVDNLPPFPIGGEDDVPFGDGIFVYAAATGTLLRANVANRNEGDGIEVLSPSTRLRDNTANGNVLWGIDAVLGVIDLGGNTATGNGAGQCRNVAC